MISKYQNKKKICNKKKINVSMEKATILGKFVDIIKHEKNIFVNKEI